MFHLIEENEYAGINHPMIEKHPKLKFKLKFTLASIRRKFSLSK